MSWTRRNLTTSSQSVTTLMIHAHFCEKNPFLHKGFDDPPRLAAGAADETEARLIHYKRVRDDIKNFVSKIPSILLLETTPDWKQQKWWKPSIHPVQPTGRITKRNLRHNHLFVSPVLLLKLQDFCKQQGNIFLWAYQQEHMFLTWGQAMVLYCKLAIMPSISLGNLPFANINFRCCNQSVRHRIREFFFRCCRAQPGSIRTGITPSCLPWHWQHYCRAQPEKTRSNSASACTIRPYQRSQKNFSLCT